MQQWTGHRNTDSLDVYIDLAFNEVTHMSKVYNTINLGAAVGVALDRIDSIEERFFYLKDSAELIGEFRSILESFRLDISSSVD